MNPLDVDLNLEPGDFIVGGAVVLKVLGADNVIRLVTRWSEGINWMEKDSMLRTAHKFETSWLEEHDDHPEGT